MRRLFSPAALWGLCRRDMGFAGFTLGLSFRSITISLILLVHESLLRFHEFGLQEWTKGFTNGMEPDQGGMNLPKFEMDIGVGA
jgi:hypothetical protein